MIDRWSRDQVLELAPDASSRKAAQGVSAPGKWSSSGVAPGAIWGECAGSGAKPYRACVDLDEPAYRCTCPSRKFPCKHALGLLLLWSADGVPPAQAPPGWAEEWLAGRRDRAERRAAAAREPKPSETDGRPEGRSDGRPDGRPGERPDERRGAEADRRAEQRERRVTSGLSELERWLADQIGQGVAGTRAAGPAHWDDLAKRLVDAQAPGVAGAVARLAPVLSGDDWPGRLVEEYALLHLLALAHRRELPGDLIQTVRSRVGFPVSREEVLAGAAVRDEWHVLGKRDHEQDRLVSRRVWLRGRTTGRAALVLSFAPIGQALDASLVTGCAVDADLAFYPGASPLRAQVALRHATRSAVGPPGVSVTEALDEVAGALAGDPWVESWPVVLAGVVPMRGDGWLLGHPAAPGGQAEGMPLAPSVGAPWRLLAASGGRPVTVAAEWTPRGLVPLSTYDAAGKVIVL
ncbi:SWIM zinc finger family protein [Spongiactinospora sp. TRM90649]|uniref:SWIM zinc finger family protein n=1 Tax=Spongiactinospora sp. TRM90649 TaxID=3031114 RepID=UPI0023F9B3AA|nr:SWIM zinc finger family protein [Spongiactinospora sp. TRM90649]MDF5752353.1 SWIM zinc finger domain-containing protein [Spongiactinospora sp. TRM90649]